MTKKVRLQGLSGAHRQGKTTLMHAIVKQHAGYATAVTTNVAGVLAARGTNAKLETTFSERLEHQRVILQHHLELWNAKIEEAPTARLVTDRTPLCFMTYTMYDLPRDLTPEQEMELEDYMCACTEAMKLFDNVILIQPGIPLTQSAGSAGGFMWGIEKYTALSIMLANRLKAHTVVMPKDIVDLQGRVAYASIFL